MYPELFRIGTFSIHSYGVMIALAFAAGIFIALWLGKKEGLGAETILDGVLWVMVSAVFGARLFYVIGFWRDFRSPWEAFMVWQGGLVFYGGLIFAILALIYFSIKYQFSILKVLDIAAPCTALGYAIGRIGCFLNGCCYGAISNLPWAVKFPNLVGARHPTQLYASLNGLLIFAVLLFLYKRRKFEGQLFSTGLIIYSVIRFLNEFLRVNPRYYLGLSEAQLISIAIFIFAAIFYGILNKRSR